VVVLTAEAVRHAKLQSNRQRQPDFYIPDALPSIQSAATEHRTGKVSHSVDLQTRLPTFSLSRAVSTVATHISMLTAIFQVNLG